MIPIVGTRDTGRLALPVLLVHAAFLVAAVSPFLVFDAAAGLVDAPNAIGRIAAGLRVMAQANAHAFYELRFQFIPNMAIDAWGLAIGGWLGADRAVNLFAAGSIVVFYTGLQALRIVLFGAGSRIVGALSVFLVYGLALRWGFLNFVFASALFVWAIAHLENHLKAPGGRFFAAGQSLLLAAIYCSSLLPALLYVVYAAARLMPEAWRALRKRDLRVLVRLAIDHGTGVAVLGLLFLASRTTPPWGGGNEWLWSRKAEGLASLVWFQAEPFEQAVGAAALVSTGVLTVLLRPRLDASHGPAILALVALFIVMPFYLNGVAFADSRLLAIILALVAALARFSPVRSAAGRLAAGILVVACAAKPVAFVRQVEPVLSARAALAQVVADVPHGSEIAMADGRDGPWIGGQLAGHLPLVLLAQGDFRLRGLFQNYFIRDRDPHPDDLAPASPLVAADAVLADICTSSGYVLVIGAAPRAAHGALAEAVARQGPFTLLRRAPTDDTGADVPRRQEGEKPL